MLQNDLQKQYAIKWSYTKFPYFFCFDPLLCDEVSSHASSHFYLLWNERSLGLGQFFADTHNYKTRNRNDLIKSHLSLH